jgi:hypothetical protein
MRTLLAVITGTLIGVGCVSAAQPLSIDQIAPSLAQLGNGWTSNHVVVLVDQLNPTNEICNEGKGWLQAAHNVVGKRGREAYMVLRYAYGSNSTLVWITRCKDPQSIGDDWARDKETKSTLASLPKVGEEVRFYQRDGMHNNIAFRRGNYLIDVESPGAPIDKLKQLAVLLDANLVKAQTAPTPKAEAVQKPDLNGR